MVIGSLGSLAHVETGKPACGRLIRRVCRGVYDYPRFSELLGQALSPEVDQVAQALARKFNWRIQPSGDAALMAGYMGPNATFDEAICEFAVEYADQNKRDYRDFINAIREGRIEASVENA